MKEHTSLLVIVPEQKGLSALAKIPGIETVLVEPGQPIPEQARIAEVLVVGPAEQQHEVDEILQQISQLPDLKLLQTLGQGIEQWDGVLPEGLSLSTARGAHGGSTAELAVASLLSLVRELPLYRKNQQARIWGGHRARTLQNMTIFIYGAGDVGLNIQSRLQPFGAKIMMVGAHTKDGVIDLVTARATLSTADVVIMALPLTNDTRHIVNTDFLARLKDGAILVNVARGDLVDQAALLAELTTGRLEAALDVTSPEPLSSDSALWEVPGLLLTPHVGGNTVGADDRAWQVAAKQIQSFIQDDASFV